LANSEFAGNPALATGAKLGAANQANQNTADYAAQVNSPAGEGAAWNNYMGSASELNPNYSGADALASGVYGPPTVPVGQGLGGFLGQALGTWSGAGYPELGGALGGVFGSPSVGSVDPTQYAGL